MLIISGVRLFRYRFRRRYSKFTLIKVVRLRFKSHGHPPFYTRKMQTKEAEPEEVFDEAWMLNGALCNYHVDMRPILISSSGASDAYQILPCVSGAADIRPHRSQMTGFSSFSSKEKTDRLAALGVLVNGLQDEKDWEYATTAQYHGQDLSLVVDFSSVADVEAVVTQVTAVHRRSVGGGVEEKPVAVTMVGSAIYSAEMKQAEQDDVLALRFRFNRDGVKLHDGGV
ncbi:hypothetical protein [Actomonas aquatica]|uniref:Uncharacterized protein n=1 Tax=Actomonas aquatica TaxID=2866162 RepID=A0ABZ1C565_9BACT|nr:hypothetical protein [Opitutus sp. WL0086]WRQ86749.1 hypothetical protein K1X11_018205 [Opitutus sp. WL0086]